MLRHVKKSAAVVVNIKYNSLLILRWGDIVFSGSEKNNIGKTKLDKTY